MAQSLYLQAMEALGPLLPPDRYDPEHDNIIEGGGNLLPPDRYDPEHDNIIEGGGNLRGTG